MASSSATSPHALTDAGPTPRARPAAPPIAVFLPSLAGGGAERIMLTLAAGFAARGHPTDLVLASASGPYLCQVPASVRVVDLGASRVLTSLPGLVRYLRQARPRALVAALGHANLAALWARTLARQRLRVVVSEHGLSDPAGRTRSKFTVAVLERLLRRAYARADAVVAVSAGLADDLAAHRLSPRERLRVIYNPVDVAAIAEQAQAPLDHPWFAPGAPPVVLSVGRLTMAKDYPLLLRAFARLGPGQPARLMILGDGEERPALEALIGELGIADRVALPGFTPNPFAYMGRAGVFALSSRWEGLPTVLIEALACGCPIVSVDCRNGPREILGEGRFGRLVAGREPEALAAALREVLAAPRAPVPPAALERYQPERVVDQYLALLAEA